MIKKAIFVVTIAGLFWLFPHLAVADSAMINWTPPTTNTDNSKLTDLAGYNVYWGTSPGNYTNKMTVFACNACPEPLGTENEVECLGLEPGKTYYFVVTAFDSNGNESGYSNEIFKTMSPAPVLLGNIDTVSPGSATRVDGRDLNKLSKCSGAGIAGPSCTNSNYDNWVNQCDSADFNHDLRIDFLDMTILGGHFGLSQ